MWTAASLTVPPVAEPLTVAALKPHLFIDDSETEFDSIIGGYIASARAHIEKMCGIRIAPQTVVMKASSWADFSILPIGPVISVGSITCKAPDGSPATVDSDNYELIIDDIDASIEAGFGISWPSIQPGSRITVTAQVGFSIVPPQLLQAMRLLVGNWFLNRENSGGPSEEILNGVSDLLVNYRRYSV